MKIGIKETEDLIKYVDSIADALVSAKKDDGKISSAEIAGIIVKTMPAGIRAVVGAGEIDDEIKDLDEKEKEELLEKSIAVMQKIAGMFIDIKIPM